MQTALEWLTNALILLCWCRFWDRADRRDTIMNPYLAAIGRTVGPVIATAKPAFFGAPDTWVALGATVLLLVFRGLLFGLIGGDRWVVVLGDVGFQVLPPAPMAAWGLFSLLSFAVVLFQVWGVALLYLSLSWPGRSEYAGRLLEHLAQPFQGIPVVYRPAALALYGMVLCGVLVAVAHPGAKFGGTAVAPLLVATIAGFVDLLRTVANLVLILIGGTWIAMFANSPRWMALFGQAIDFFVGPAKRLPLRVGALDLTPLVVYVVLVAVHRVLRNALPTVSVVGG